MDPTEIAQLTEVEALRYKAILGPLSSDALRDMVQPMLPPMLSSEATDKLAVALSAAAKCFAVEVAQEARALQEAHAAAAGMDVANASILPAHMNEAYRRMLLRGRILGAETLSLASAQRGVHAVAVAAVEGPAQAHGVGGDVAMR